MTSYVNWQVPIWDNFIKKTKVLGGIPINSLVETLSTVGDMTQIQYGTYRGWVETRYVEPYVHNLPYNCVDVSDIATPSTTDAAQYVIVDGVKQVNMCGEMCIAYGTKQKLSEVLTQWKGKALPFYKRIFGSGKAAGTTSADLVNLLGIQGHTGIQLEKWMKKYTPTELGTYLSDCHIIAGCNMDGTTGVLRGSGVGHWVLITAVQPERMGMGWIEVYNPFPNCIERYSWREWLATTKNYPYGVLWKGGFTDVSVF